MAAALSVEALILVTNLIRKGPLPAFLFFFFSGYEFGVGNLSCEELVICDIVLVGLEREEKCICFSS